MMMSEGTACLFLRRLGGAMGPLGLVEESFGEANAGTNVFGVLGVAMLTVVFEVLLFIKGGVLAASGAFVAGVKSGLGSSAPSFRPGGRPFPLIFRVAK